MKKALFIFVLAFIGLNELSAQRTELSAFNQERLQVNKIGMIVLGSWAIGNMATNGVLLRNPKSAEQGHFYRMNIFWNVVNLGLAIPGLRHSIMTDPAALTLAETVSEYHQMGKIVILNAGLDVAYIAGGFLLKEMAKTRPNKRHIMRGYGRALILQGGFLLAFDIGLFVALQTKNAKLAEILSSISVNANGIGLAMQF